MRRRVAIIGTVGLPARYGGFETLAENLVESLGERFDFTVYCSSKARKSCPSHFGRASLKYLPLSANGIQSIPYDALSLADAARHADVALVLGVGGAMAFPAVRVASKTRIVVNVDGVEWQREKWGRVARWTLRTSEAVAVRTAHVVVADNLEIVRYVSSRYRVEPALIPYGGDHVRSGILTEQLRGELTLPDGEYALALTRIEPENNIRMLLEGFCRAQTKLNLVIVGNWNASAFGRALRAEFSGRKKIVLLDPIYEPKIREALRSGCRIYIHGHSAGGTNPSLVEAMWLRLPVFVFDVGYNRATTQNRARYFGSAQDLAKLLECAEIGALKRISRAMGEIAEKSYSWRSVADSYAELFESPPVGISQTNR